MTIKQYRITTKNLDYPQDDDCIIDENDPIHNIKKSNLVGGLGSPEMVQSEVTQELIKKYWPDKK
jgi:hypothetical protein